MKPLLVFTLCCVLCTNAHAQFEKNEKLFGGNFSLYKIKEKNVSTSPGGGPFGSTLSDEKGINLQPEFGYTVTKNLVVSILGGIATERYVNPSDQSVFKTQGFTAGVAITKYQFFTKGFGMLLKLQGTYSPSWDKYYYTDGTGSLKNWYYLTEVNLQGGVFYRFGKHFCIETMLGHLTYDHLLTEPQGTTDRDTHKQFNAGLYNDVRLSIYYIFKKIGKK